MRRELQCKALRRLQKSRRRRNNGEQWKKQCAEQWKQSEIRARADPSPGHIDIRRVHRRGDAGDGPGGVGKNLQPLKSRGYSVWVRSAKTAFAAAHSVI